MLDLKSISHEDLKYIGDVMGLIYAGPGVVIIRAPVYPFMVNAEGNTFEEALKIFKHYYSIAVCM